MRNVFNNIISIVSLKRPKPLSLSLTPIRKEIILATLRFTCALNIRSSFNKSSTLSNENTSALISRPKFKTPFEECLNKYDENERAQSNDAEKRNEAIINSDNSNETTLHFATSSSKAASNNLKHFSLNNENLIDNLRQNKTIFNSFQSELALLDWGQTLRF